MRQFLALFAAFTIGAMTCQIYNDRKIADLKVEIDSAYHEGSDDGYRTGTNDARAHATRQSHAARQTPVTLKDARDLADILTQR